MMAYLAIIWALLVSQVVAEVQLHDKAFKPDYVLHASASNITVNCENRYSVTINGSVPGPTIYLLEGHATWIRFYNDIGDQNVTLVRQNYIGAVLFAC